VPPDALPARAEAAKAGLSLASRGAPLASPERQIEAVASVDLSGAPFGGSFDAALSASGRAPLRPGAVEVLQVNLGKLCNMSCRHCHVDAGPDRTAEQMSRATAEACLAALDRTGARTLDLTGGAPELNPNFRFLVDGAVRRGVHVLDRCNLTVLLAASQRDLPEWLGERGVELVCSLPHWRRRGTDAQRGDGTFDRSLEALRLLNGAGYGKGDPGRTLTLVSNPVGAFLPGNQAEQEREWKAGLAREHGVAFDRLLLLANMPISRYLEWLEESGNLSRYLEALLRAFNPATVDGLMCRGTLSIGWDGTVHDCDFNQMLGLEARSAAGRPFRVQDLDPAELGRRQVVTGRHCFGCTAGAGSSCGGAIEG
jgi:radical SAM/Cys-rich protein